MNEQIIPHALLIPPLAETDYIVGGVTQIEPVQRNPSGDWTAYLPTDEPQKYLFDTNECSQLSGINTVETQCNFLLKNNQLSSEAVQWFTSNGYIDSNGNFAFSERFTGTLSGTTINGNSQWAFWQTVSRYGLLPRQDFNYSMAQSQKFSTQQEMCNDYYNINNITDAMKAKALQTAKYISVQYQYVWFNLSQSCPVNLMTTALQHAPLQIGTEVCPSWNSGMVYPCGETTPSHATEMVKWNGDKSSTIRDHYAPYDKTLEIGYFYPIVVQGVISSVPQVPYVTLQTEIWFIQILKSIGLWKV